MTYIVSSGALNSTHSLTRLVFVWSVNVEFQLISRSEIRNRSLWQIFETCVNFFLQNEYCQKKKQKLIDCISLTTIYNEADK